MSAQILFFPIPNKRDKELREAYQAAALADYEREQLEIFCKAKQESRKCL